MRGLPAVTIAFCLHLTGCYEVEIEDTELGSETYELESAQEARQLPEVDVVTAASTEEPWAVISSPAPDATVDPGFTIKANAGPFGFGLLLEVYDNGTLMASRSS